MMFKFSKHSGSVPLSRTTRLTLCRYAAPGNTGRFAVVPTGDLPVVGFNGQLDLTATALCLWIFDPSPHAGRVRVSHFAPHSQAGGSPHAACVRVSPYPPKLHVASLDNRRCDTVRCQGDTP